MQHLCSTHDSAGSGVWPWPSGPRLLSLSPPRPHSVGVSKDQGPRALSCMAWLVNCWLTPIVNWLPLDRLHHAVSHHALLEVCISGSCHCAGRENNCGDQQRSQMFRLFLTLIQALMIGCQTASASVRFCFDLSLASLTDSADSSLLL